MNQQQITQLYEDYYADNDWGTGQVKSICQVVLGEYYDRRLEVPQSILDVGCGKGHYANRFHELLPDTSVMGMDVSKNAIDKAWELYGNKAHHLIYAVQDVSKLTSRILFDLIFVKGCSLLNKRHFTDTESLDFIAKLRGMLHKDGLLVLVERTDFSASIPNGSGWHCRSWLEMQSLFADSEILFFSGDRVIPKPESGMVDYMVIYERE